MKKYLALVLALLMSVMLFAGCAPAETTDPADSTPASESQDTEEDSSTEDAGAIPTAEDPFEWHLCISNATMPGIDAVEEAMVSYIKEELGFDVNINWYDFGNHGQQMQLKLAGNEQIDLMFTSTWTNNFYSDVARGAYKALDLEKIKEVAPNVWEGVLPASAWDSATVNGELYAIPNTQIHARSYSVMYVNKYVEEAGFDPTTVKTLADLEPLFEYIVANYPDVTPFMHTGASDAYGFTPFGYETFGTTNPVGFKIGEATPTAVNMHETPEMLEYYELMRRWNELGYIRPDAATLTEADLAVDIKAGKFAVRTALNNPDTLSGNLPVWGFEATDSESMSIVPFDVAPFLGSGEVAKTMAAIGVNSQYETQAYQIYNLLYDKENPYLINLISYGIEGVNWQFVDEATKVIEPLDNANYWDQCGWAYGNLFDTYKTSAAAADWYPTGPDTLNAAITSDLVGFSFDMEPVSSEMTQLASVVSEFMPTLQGGAASDVAGTLATFNEQLDTAGMDKVLAEYQTQVDAFMASK